MHYKVLACNARLLWIPPESCGSYLMDVVAEIDDHGIASISKDGETVIITHISNVVLDLRKGESDEDSRI